MALAQFMFDNTPVPFTKKQGITYTNKQNENETEGGHTIIQTIRKNVFSMSVSTRCLSSVVKIYREFSEKDSFVLTYFDTKTETTATKTVHMEGYSESLVEKSQNFDASVTNGIYDVSFTLEEF